MTRKQIIIAVSLAVVALVVAGSLWLWVGLPFLLDNIRGSTVIPPPAADFTEAAPTRPVTLPTEIAGIGAVLRADPGTGLPEVMDTIPGSPAERAGIAAGWLILKVDDLPLAGLPLREPIDMIRGPVGSKVRLELLDPQQEVTNTVEVTRERIQVGGHP
jgi:carboxyl-terminal processing protease